MDKCFRFINDCSFSEYEYLKNFKINCSELFDKVKSVIINTNEANCDNHDILLTQNNQNNSNFIVNFNNNQTFFRCVDFTSFNNWIYFICKKLNTCLKNNIFSNIYKKNYLTNSQNDNLSKLENDHICRKHNLLDKSFKFYDELITTAEQTSKEINNFSIDTLKNNTIYESSVKLIEEEGIKSTNSNIVFQSESYFTEGILKYEIIYISLILFLVIFFLTYRICFYKRKTKYHRIPSDYT